MDRLIIDCSTGTRTVVPFTPAEEAERATLAAAEASAIVAATAFRGQIVTLAQSAVGVRLQDLTPAQIKALMACLLYKAGGVDPSTLQVRPLGQWVT